MTGSISVLKLKGDQDLMLTDIPQVNFIKNEYKRNMRFAVEKTKVQFAGAVDFGKKISILLPNKADYLNSLYFCFSLPALSETSGTYASWTNSIGHYIIKHVDLEIGDRLIDRHYGLFLDIWEELTGDDKNENHLVGKYSNMETLKINASQESYYTVPLKFWFCNSIAQSLPIGLLEYHKVRLNFYLQPFSNCVNYDGTTPPNTVKITDAYVLADYIYTEEREPSIQKEILITQVQYNDTQGDAVNTSGSVFKSRVPFNHPVFELLWVFIEKESVDNNDHFNYSKRSSDPFQKRFSLMKNATFHIDGKEYTQVLTEEVYRLLYTNRYHKNTTDRFIYCLPFCEYPQEGLKPSGSLNFSLVDDFVISGDMRTPTPENNVHVFGINYNWLIINKGISALKYLT